MLSLVLFACYYLFTIIIIWLIILFLTFIVCEICGKDFESINRHTCRCKSRSSQSSSNSNVANDNVSSNNTAKSEITNNRSISNVEWISCFCGKQCKGHCGLKAHQRLCRAIKSIIDNFVDSLENDYNKLNDDSNFDINVDNNLSVDTTNKSPSFKKNVIPTTSCFD